MWNNTATIKRKKPIHRESELQQACVKWFKLQYPKRIIIAIPNGGKRNRTEAAIMQGEGVMPGVCDLFIPEPTMSYHGLWIEMKVGKNSTTKNQNEFIISMLSRNYSAYVVYDFDSFFTIVEQYFCT